MIYEHADVDEQGTTLETYLGAFVPSDGRILEVGCGRGSVRSFLGSRGEYVGVDLVLPGLEAVEFGETLPIGFDCTVAVKVLQHIIEDAAFVHWVGQLFASLKPGGVLVVVDRQPMEARGKLAAFAHWVGQLFASQRNGNLADRTRARGMLAVLERPEADNMKGLNLDFDGHWLASFWKREDHSMEIGDAPTFRREGDRVTLETEMPGHVLVTSELLETGGRPRLHDADDPPWLTRSGDQVDFTFANGHYRYGIIGWRNRMTEAVCRREFSGPAEPEKH